jgi:hypothetical protein
VAGCGPSGPGRQDSDRAGGQRGLVGGDDELGAVACAQFHHGPVDVGAHRVGAEVELGGDVVVAAALGGQGHYLAFPGGQAGEAAGRC